MQIAYNGYSMQRTFWIWILSASMILTACAPTIPTPEADVNPPASSADLNPDSEKNNLVIPYSEYIRFEQISLEEGLSQSVVNDILQDSQGFLWVGTDDGLNRYDGYDFKVYKPDINNPHSLNDRSITSLAEDANANIWVGTRSGGLNFYNSQTGQFFHYMHDDANDASLASNQITSLCLDENGLWVGTDNGLDFFEFETQTFTHFRSPTDTPPDSNSLSGNFISTLYKDSNGLLWIGTSNAGINVYNKKTSSLIAYKFKQTDPTSLSSNRILSIAEGKNGEMWIGTANGLNRYNSVIKIFTRFTNSANISSSLAGSVVFEVFVDSAGSLWVGTNNGLDRFDEQTKKFIHHQRQLGVPNSLSNNQIYKIFEDASGVLWVGTYGGGLNKYNRQQDRFAYYRNNPSNENSLSSNFITTILTEENGAVWVGTFDGGLNQFDLSLNRFIRFKHDAQNLSTLASNYVTALFKDSNGVLWVGTNRGLDKFNSPTKTFTHFQPALSDLADSPNVLVLTIYEDSEKTLWVGTTRGLFIFNRNSEKFISYELTTKTSSDATPDRVNAIVEDDEKTLWLGTFDDGLKRINLQTGAALADIQMPNDNSTIGSNSILSLYQDSFANLWIGTNGGGLWKYNPATETFTQYTENEGLPNNVIYGILEDHESNLWLSTNFGLSRFNPESKSFRNFTANDGLQSNEFNQNAFAVDTNGLMYFGGINGLNVFEPQEITDSPYSPNIALTSLTLDGIAFAEEEKTTEYLESITLQYPQDSFEFEFSSFAYEQPNKNQYAYMLEGFDADWINIGNQRNGRYTNLSGGAYTLLLRGSNSDQVWSEQNKAIQIIVIPPYWETWWFRTLFVITFGVALAGGLRWRVKNIENRNRELERLVRKRTSDLEKRNSEIEALYQADEKILRSVTLNQIFQALVDVSVSILSADRSVVFGWDESQNKIVPRVSKGFQSETLAALTFDRDEGMIGAAMRTGEAFVISNIKSSSLRKNVKTLIEKEGIESFAHFPIVVDGKVISIFNVAYTRPNALTKDSIRLFTALVNRASMSIANMDLFEQTKDLAVMEERNRLARDLHDSAKQKAFAALAQLGTVNGMSKTVAQEASPHVVEAETLIYEVIQELNFLIQEIYPIALQEKGLEVTLREYIFEWENRNDAQVNFQIQHGRDLPLELEQAVYRVIQEALANIARHSKAKRVDVSLVYTPELLQVVIADDGCGFDMNQKPKGVGFRSMRERINSIRGTFQVQSAPNQGTRLIIQIPLKNNAGG
jgi:ligand-binding sensor domain-containing protein/signal transduction histidine kinase